MRLWLLVAVWACVFPVHDGRGLGSVQEETEGFIQETTTDRYIARAATFYNDYVGNQRNRFDDVQLVLLNEEDRRAWCEFYAMYHDSGLKSALDSGIQTYLKQKFRGKALLGSQLACEDVTLDSKSVNDLLQVYQMVPCYAFQAIFIYETNPRVGFGFAGSYKVPFYLEMEHFSVLENCTFLEVPVLSEEALGIVRVADEETVKLRMYITRNVFAAAFDSLAVKTVFRFLLPMAHIALTVYSCFIINLRQQKGWQKTTYEIRLVLCTNAAVHMVLALVLVLDGYGTARNFDADWVNMNRLMLYGYGLATDLFIACAWLKFRTHSAIMNKGKSTFVSSVVTTTQPYQRVSNAATILVQELSLLKKNKSFKLKALKGLAFFLMFLDTLNSIMLTLDPGHTMVGLPVLLIVIQLFTGYFLLKSSIEGSVVMAIGATKMEDKADDIVSNSQDASLKIEEKEDVDKLNSMARAQQKYAIHLIKAIRWSMLGAFTSVLIAVLMITPMYFRSPVAYLVISAIFIVSKLANAWAQTWFCNPGFVPMDSGFKSKQNNTVVPVSM